VSAVERVERGGGGGDGFETHDYTAFLALQKERSHIKRETHQDRENNATRQHYNNTTRGVLLGEEERERGGGGGDGLETHDHAAILAPQRERERFKQEKESIDTTIPLEYH